MSGTHTPSYYIVNEAMTHLVLSFPEQQTLEFPMPETGVSSQHAHEWGKLEMSWEADGPYHALQVEWNGQPVHMKLD
jgi:hypothetical protein